MKLISKISFAAAGISLVAFSVSRFILGGWIPFLWVLLGMFALFMVIPLFTDKEILLDFFMMRTTKHGLNMGAMIVLVVLCLGLLNFLSVRHYATFDFSAAQLNTLSDQSVKLAKSLDSELKVLFFYKKGVQGNEENRKAFREIIKKYQDQTSKIQLEFVEVNERPDLAKEYGVDKGSGLAFFDYKGRRNRIEKIDEQELTGALVKVTREKNKTIYFIVGHGESSLEDQQEANGLASIKSMLENNRYTVKTHATTTTPKIPEDADVVVIAGPKQEFQEMELSGLRDYLKRGGSLIVALKAKQNTGLEKLSKEVGIEFGNDFVFTLIDIPGIGKNIQPDITLGVDFSNTQDITKAFGKGEIIRFHSPQSLKRVNPIPPGITIEDLVSSGRSSMVYTELDFNKPGTEQNSALVSWVKGRFPGGDSKAKDFSMLVAGDSDFFGNELLYKNLNRDLFLNSVAALAKEDNMISVTPKEPEMTQMHLTNTQFSLFLFGFVIPLPLLMFSSSIMLWFRRRNA